MATNGSFDQPAVTAGPADTSASGNNLSKDEVGWYFVEQYYTTLSKSPEKLHVSLYPILPGDILAILRRIFT